MSSELCSLVVVYILQVVLLDRIRSDARIICDDFVPNSQMLSFHAPADCAWHSSEAVLDGRFVIDGSLFRTHLICEEPCVSRLVDTGLWILQSRAKSLGKTLLSIIVELDGLAPATLVI